MSEADPRFSSNGVQVYISPVLAELEESAVPKPLPACGTCPASLWFSSSEFLKCFCTRMHLITWDGVETSIMECDGRELAIAQILAEG